MRSKTISSGSLQFKAKATFKALSEMRDAHAVAQQRGVELSKVFNG